MMPTQKGKEFNAICLKCDNLDLDRPKDPAGWCSKYDRHIGLNGKPMLLELHYCLFHKNAGRKVYEINLVSINKHKKRLNK